MLNNNTETFASKKNLGKNEIGRNHDWNNCTSLWSDSQ